MYGEVFAKGSITMLMLPTSFCNDYIEVASRSVLRQGVQMIIAK